MAFVFLDSTNNHVSGATSIGAGHSFAVGALLVGYYGFQNVAPGSGPWSDPNHGQYTPDHIGPISGWQMVGFQAPSSTGVGLEVWAAINSTTGATGRILAFLASETCQVVMGAWSGAWEPTGSITDGAVQASSFAQVVGNAPPSPSVFAFASQLIIAGGGDEMTASQFGTPVGYTTRVDVAGGGAGSVECVIADNVAVLTGATGPITFPNNASSGSTAGSMATLAIRPSVPPTTGAPLLDINYPAT